MGGRTNDEQVTGEGIQRPSVALAERRGKRDRGVGDSSGAEEAHGLWFPGVRTALGVVRMSDHLD